MKRILSLFFVLILVGCGKDYDPDLNRPHVNTDLAVYVNRFVQVADSLGRPVSLGRIQIDFVATMERNVIGKCYSGIMTPRIEINRSYWERQGVSNSDRESLMFHELGHCILGRGHDDRGMPGYNWLDISIMNSYHTEKVYYENNWEYYMKELFGVATYFTLSAVSQFPGQYYEVPGAVPLPTASTIMASSVERPVVYTTSEDDISEGFHCGEVH